MLEAGSSRQVQGRLRTHRRNLIALAVIDTTGAIGVICPIRTNGWLVAHGLPLEQFTGPFSRVPNGLELTLL